MKSLRCECGFITDSIEELNEHQRQCEFFQRNQSLTGRRALIEALGGKEQ